MCRCQITLNYRLHSLFSATMPLLEDNCSSLPMAFSYWETYTGMRVPGMVLWVLNSSGLFSTKCQAGREPLSLWSFLVFVVGLYYCKDTLSCCSSGIPRDLRICSPGPFVPTLHWPLGCPVRVNELVSPSAALCQVSVSPFLWAAGVTLSSSPALSLTHPQLPAVRGHLSIC